MVTTLEGQANQEFAHLDLPASYSLGRIQIREGNSARRNNSAKSDRTTGEGLKLLYTRYRLGGQREK